MNNKDKTTYVVIEHDDNDYEFAAVAFSTKHLAEQDACCRVQKAIEDYWDMHDDYAGDAETASKINDLISKENYAAAIEEFTDHQNEISESVSIKVLELPIKKDAEKPVIRAKDFFVALVENELEDWQAEVSDGGTKLGFEEWKRKNKK